MSVFITNITAALSTFDLSTGIPRSVMDLGSSVRQGSKKAEAGVEPVRQSINSYSAPTVCQTRGISGRQNRVVPA